MKEFITIFYEWLTNPLGKFVGGYDNLLRSLVIFIIIEFLTEIMCYIIKKKRTKKLSVNGICQVITIFLMIGIANTLDICILNNYNLLRTISIYYYISVEGKMLLKNIKKINGNIPPKIKEVLKKIKKKSENDDESK